MEEKIQISKEEIKATAINLTKEEKEKVFKTLSKSEKSMFMLLSEENQNLHLSNKKLESDKKEFLENQKKKIKDNLRMEINSIGFHLEIPINAFMNNEKDKYTEILNLSQWGGYGNWVTDVISTDGQEYGLQIVLVKRKEVVKKK